MKLPKTIHECPGFPCGNTELVHAAGDRISTKEQRLRANHKGSTILAGYVACSGCKLVDGERRCTLQAFDAIILNQADDTLRTQLNRPIIPLEGMARIAVPLDIDTRSFYSIRPGLDGRAVA